LIFGTSGPTAKKKEGKPGPRERCTVVLFDIPASECIRRIKARKNHPTLSDDGKTSIPGVVKMFTSRLERPTVAEGFKRVFVVKSAKEATALALNTFGVTLHPTTDDASGDAAAASGNDQAGGAAAGLADEARAGSDRSPGSGELAQPIATSAQQADLAHVMSELGLSAADTAARSALVDRIIKTFAEQLPGIAVVAVGSTACGLALQGSDVDLACVVLAGEGGLPTTGTADGGECATDPGVETARQHQLDTVASILRGIPGLAPPEVIFTRSKVISAASPLSPPPATITLFLACALIFHNLLPRVNKRVDV
jgi:hypothetical protein